MKARLSSSPEAQVSVLALPGRGGSGSQQCVSSRSVLCLSTHDPERHVPEGASKFASVPPNYFSPTGGTFPA